MFWPTRGAECTPYGVGSSVQEPRQSEMCGLKEVLLFAPLSMVLFLEQLRSPTGSVKNVLAQKRYCFMYPFRVFPQLSGPVRYKSSVGPKDVPGTLYVPFYYHY